MFTYLRSLRATGAPSLTALFCLLLATSSACSETLSGQNADGSGSGGDSISSSGGTNGDGDGDGDGDSDGDGDGDGGTSGDGDGDGDTSGGTSGDGDGDTSGGTTGSGGSNSGGSNSGGSDAGGSGGTDTTDTEPPSVVSMSPEADEDGVTEDAQLVIQFSEAMDAAATESAFSSSTLPGTPSFSWSADDTELTISLSQPLAYAEGSTTAVSAREYDYTISSAATDAAGNPLPELNVSFTTLRRVATSLPGIPILDGFAQAGGGYDHAYDSDAVSGWYNELELVTFLTFDTSSLPDNIADFESASLYAYQTEVYVAATPYEQFGDLVLQHTTFASVTHLALSSAPLRNLGVFSTDDSVEWHSIDVEAALEEDYTLRVTRENRSQYWLRFPGGPDGNTAYTATSFYTADDEEYPPRIDVVYLLP
jgi:hypothetical protein